MVDVTEPLIDPVKLNDPEGDSVMDLDLDAERLALGVPLWLHVDIV